MSDGLRIIRTPAGGLGVLHFADLSFTPKRIYWLFGTPDGVERGLHAHKQLEQYVFCKQGAARVVLDDGDTSREHVLEANADGLWIRPGMWRAIQFLQRASVLMVVASHDYDPDDYIHDYGEFLEWVRRGE